MLLGRRVEHGEAEERAIPGIEGAEGQGGPGGPAGDEDHPAVLAEQGDGDLEVRLALGLVPDVDALGRELAEPGGDVVGLVIQGEVGAQAPADLELLGAARGGGDAGPGRLGHLHGHRPHAAGAARDVHRLAGLELAELEEPQVGRDPDQGHGRGVAVGQEGGGGVQPGLVDGRVSAATPWRPNNPWFDPQTRSPARSRVQFGPTFSTVPARSQPMM